MKTLLNRYARVVYRVPGVGLHFRRLVEAFQPNAPYRSRDYWNDSLKGWAASYLGGTMNVDLRNAVSVRLAREFAPAATSLLDLGCAGGTLALAIGPEFTCYWGVDISDVAIADATKRIDHIGGRTFEERRLVVGEILEVEFPRTFDLIVLNEVLYYLRIDEVSEVINRSKALLNPGGIIIVTLKDHEQCRPILTVLRRHLRLVHGILLQPKGDMTDWQTSRSAEEPAALIQAYQP